MRIAAAMAVVCLPAPGAAEADHPQPRRILIVNSYHKEFAWTDAQVTGAREVLTSAFDEIELYVEYLDTKRIAYEGEYLDLLDRTFRLKYKGVKLDAIITTDDNALRLVMKLHEDVFRGAPVAFCGINDYQPSLLTGRDQFTGLVEVLDIKPTVDLAMKLHPKTRKVVVVVDDTPTGMGQRRDVAAVADQYKNLHFEYLKGENLTHAELLTKLGELDSDSIVLLTVWLRDKTGAFLATDIEGPHISESSAVPVYGIIDMYLGHGIVGGKVLNSRTHGRTAAGMVVRILSGEKPADIPVLIESVNPYMFDARQLQRWGIDETNLPEGSTVLHRPFSFYEEYKALIWQVITAFATLVLLLLILAVSIIRRRRAEQALRLHAAIMDNVAEGIFLVGLDDLTIKWTNERFARMFGYEPGEIDGKHVDTINAPADRTPSETRISIVDVLKETGEWHGEVRNIKRDGTHFWCYANVSLFDHPEYGKVIVSVHTDITEHKGAEEQRLNLERQVQHAQKLESLGVLAGGIAHDFNNLLMVILGNADLAMDELASHAPARDNIEEVLKASRRAAELAKQMLAYSGKGRFVVEPIRLGELVEEMAHLLDVSVSKKAVLKYNFADNLPTFDGDATQIRQIIMNLITNASEAIGDESGVIALSTGAMDCDRAYLDGVHEILLAGMDEPLPDGLYVYLEVADTGCGMDAETIGKVFDPFFTTKFTGRGLGMAAVLGIVRGHRGAIKVYSEVGKGTTFKALFPASELPAGGDVIQRPDLDQLAEWHGRGTVLIADDEETICAVGKRMLGKMGFSVLTAANGREAVEIFGAHADEIVCILLDLTMSHMDGEQAFRELRRIRSDVAVILCSGYNEQDATQRFAGKGLAGFIQKPYHMRELRGKLMQVLSEDGQAGSAS